jgi:hypothetical protein
LLAESECRLQTALLNVSAIATNVRKPPFASIISSQRDRLILDIGTRSWGPRFPNSRHSWPIFGIGIIDFRVGWRCNIVDGRNYFFILLHNLFKN